MSIFPFLFSASFHAFSAMCYDLFGEFPVTEDDIISWVAAVAPRWLSPEQSFRHYVHAWNVPDKIRSAKLAGMFHEITARPRTPWHARLALDAVI
jgi:hypothetical protein